MDNLINDIHRTRYLHKCDKCQQDVYSYRDCTNEHHICGGVLKMIEKIPAVSYNFENGKTYAPIAGRTFFSVEFGRDVSTSEIKKLCKENGYVYADDKDLSADAARNKEYNEKKHWDNFRKEIIENTMRELT